MVLSCDSLLGVWITAGPVIKSESLAHDGQSLYLSFLSSLQAFWGWFSHVNFASCGAQSYTGHLLCVEGNNHRGNE